MTLFRRKMVKYEPCRKFVGDLRRVKAWAVFEYRDGDGEEYRRAFWADKGTSRTEFDLMAPLIINGKAVAV